MSPKIHSTEQRTAFIDLLYASICGANTRWRKGAVSESLGGKQVPHRHLSIGLSVRRQTFEGCHTGVNSIKKYKCNLQVGPLFLQIPTNLNPLKVFTSSRYKPPTCSYNGILLDLISYNSKIYMCTLHLLNWPQVRFCQHCCMVLFSPLLIQNKSTDHKYHSHVYWDLSTCPNYWKYNRRNIFELPKIN